MLSPASLIEQFLYQLDLYPCIQSAQSVIQSVNRRWKDGPTLFLRRILFSFLFSPCRSSTRCIFHRHILSIHLSSASISKVLDLLKIGKSAVNLSIHRVRRTLLCTRIYSFERLPTPGTVISSTSFAASRRIRCSRPEASSAGRGRTDLASVAVRKHAHESIREGHIVAR